MSLVVVGKSVFVCVWGGGGGGGAQVAAGHCRCRVPYETRMNMLNTASIFDHTQRAHDVK